MPRAYHEATRSGASRVPLSSHHETVCENELTLSMRIELICILPGGTGLRFSNSTSSCRTRCPVKCDLRLCWKIKN